MHRLNAGSLSITVVGDTVKSGKKNLQLVLNCNGIEQTRLDITTRSLRVGSDAACNFRINDSAVDSILLVMIAEDDGAVLIFPKSTQVLSVAGTPSTPESKYNISIGSSIEIAGGYSIILQKSSTASTKSNRLEPKVSADEFRFETTVAETQEESSQRQTEQSTSVDRSGVLLPSIIMVIMAALLAFLYMPSSEGSGGQGQSETDNLPALNELVLELAERAAQEPENSRTPSLKDIHRSLVIARQQEGESKFVSISRVRDLLRNREPELCNLSDSKDTSQTLQGEQKLISQLYIRLSKD
jgi:hypothetical protein